MNTKFMNFIHVVSFLEIPYHLLYPNINDCGLLFPSQVSGIVLRILHIIITLFTTTTLRGRY